MRSLAGPFDVEERGSEVGSVNRNNSRYPWDDTSSIHKDNEIS
jgi:hypothetical protein